MDSLDLISSSHPVLLDRTMPWIEASKLQLESPFSGASAKYILYSMKASTKSLYHSSFNQDNFISDEISNEDD